MNINLKEIKERILEKKLEKVIGEFTNEKIIQLNQEILNTYQKEAEKIAKLFYNIEKDINFKEEGKTPLYIAIKEGYGELISYLIDNGADLNNINEENQTALDLIQNINNANINEAISLEADWQNHNVEPIGENPDYSITIDY